MNQRANLIFERIQVVDRVSLRGARGCERKQGDQKPQPPSLHRGEYALTVFQAGDGVAVWRASIALASDSDGFLDGRVGWRYPEFMPAV